MTGDELERAIEFLLKNQAAFDARQAALDARQAAFDARQAALDEKFEAEREKTNQQISALAEAQQATQLQLNHLTNVVASIAETTQRNSEDIDALVKLVGGLVEGRNGKRGS
jgi:flagellar capping protein FliD